MENGTGNLDENDRLGSPRLMTMSLLLFQVTSDCGYHLPKMLICFLKINDIKEKLKQLILW